MIAEYVEAALGAGYVLVGVSITLAGVRLHNWVMGQ